MNAPFIMPEPALLPPHVLRAKLARVIADAQGLLDLLDEEEGIYPDRDEDLEPEAGYDLPEGDDELCASSEVDGEWTAFETFGKGFHGNHPDDVEDDGAAEPSLGSLEGRECQINWAGGCDDDRERDESDREPYLSVVEFDGGGDNWHRHGQPTSGDGFDIEDVNADGAGMGDMPWWWQEVCAGEATHA